MSIINPVWKYYSNLFIGGQGSDNLGGETATLAVEGWQENRMDSIIQISRE